MKTSRRGFLRALGLAPLVPLIPALSNAKANKLEASSVNNGARALEGLLARNFPSYEVIGSTEDLSDIIYNVDPVDVPFKAV